nr:uncharacterized protein LOC113844887 isoform X2 [Anas platyrhynchos]
MHSIAAPEPLDLRALRLARMSNVEIKFSAPLGGRDLGHDSCSFQSTSLAALSTWRPPGGASRINPSWDRSPPPLSPNPSQQHWWLRAGPAECPVVLLTAPDPQQLLRNDIKLTPNRVVRYSADARLRFPLLTMEAVGIAAPLIPPPASREYPQALPSPCAAGRRLLQPRPLFVGARCSRRGWE